MTIYREHELPRFFRKHNLRIPPDMVDYEQDRCNPDADGNVTELMTRLFKDQEISVLVGEPHVAKTPLSYSIARTMACGRPLDNLHKPMGDTRSALIISGEMSQHQWGKFKEWNDRMYPLSESADTFVEIYNSRYKLDTPEGRKYIEGLVRHVNSTHPDQKNVSVLILDNLKSLTSNGDSQQHWNKLFDFLDTLRKRHGWTIIVIHHTNKDGKAYGTVNINAKVDNMVYIGKKFGEICDLVQGTEAWIRPTEKLKLKDYFDFVQTNVAKNMLAGRYANSLFFFMGVNKGKMFSTAEKLPVFMRMLPEDEQPKWEAIDILADDSPYNWSHFEDAEQSNTTQQDDECNETEQIKTVPLDTKPSYDELRNANKELVLRWLRKAFADGRTSHRELGLWMGFDECKAKSQIEYLLKRHGIRDDDFKA